MNHEEINNQREVNVTGATPVAFGEDQRQPEQTQYQKTIEAPASGNEQEQPQSATEKPGTMPSAAAVGVLEEQEPTLPGDERELQRNQLEEAQRRALEWEKQAAEFKDQWLRAVADFKNYKRRSEAEREELRKHAHADLLLRLLPVVDDLERAIASVPQEIATSSWWEGTVMIAQKLRMVLESVGVKPIEAEGAMFDPTKHHAVSYEEVEGRDNQVIEVLQTGYFLHDQVLRPAMVKVGKHP